MGKPRAASSAREHHARRTVPAYLTGPVSLALEIALALSVYEASVPGYQRMLSNLSHMLDKAEAYARENGIDLATLAEARLAPDMRPLTAQVQMASDSAKGGAARLAGVEPPSFPDVETTFPELKDRIARTIAFLDTIKPEQLEGAETRTIEMRFPQRTMTFNGRDFLLGFSLANFHFHIVTAYAILRSQGVPLGKPDYLAGANA